MNKYDFANRDSEDRNFICSHNVKVTAPSASPVAGTVPILCFSGLQVKSSLNENEMLGGVTEA